MIFVNARQIKIYGEIAEECMRAATLEHWINHGSKTAPRAEKQAVGRVIRRSFPNK